MLFNFNGRIATSRFAQQPAARIDTQIKSFDQSTVHPLTSFYNPNFELDEIMLRQHDLTGGMS
jgi:hypothetical protein